MRRLIAVTLAFVASSAIAQARIVGLVEIPALHSGVNETGSSVADRALAPVTLYAEPTYSAAAAFVVRERRELESLEHDYEHTLLP